MKKALAICAAIALSLSALAQTEAPAEKKGHAGMHEKFEAEKIAFITQKLDLSVEEAQAFWPVYNEYSKAAEAAHQSVMRATKQLRKSDELSDADAQKLIDELLAAKQQEADLMARYTARFKQVLPIKKVAALFAAEDDFRMHLFKKFKDDGPHKGGKRMHARIKDASKEPADKTQK